MEKWTQASSGSGPVLAVLVADSGLGKSRLVQALYQQLAGDERWDPQEIDYWPDTFQGAGKSLFVNPELLGHVPKGPPRFLWLGVRWQEPQARNVEERICPLPDLRDKLLAHVETARNHGSRWAQLGDRVIRGLKKEGLGEAAVAAAELVVPFAGLMGKLAQGAASSLRGLGDRSMTAQGQEQASRQGAGEELLEMLDEVLRRGAVGGEPLPVVLWLDDAQWCDPVSQRFIADAWAKAGALRLPLLIVATYWEREWRQSLKALRDGDAEAEASPVLARLQADAQVCLLGKAPASDLGAYLDVQLPGLTARQRQLVLDKADGNFLTMTENVGALLSQPARFVGRDVAAALTAGGERHVAEWESDRERRVEQHFNDELEAAHQDVLSWGSRIGMSFLHEVLHDFAVQGGLLADRGTDARQVLDECVDPLAVLATPHAAFGEFRDRAWFAVARRFFDDCHAEHAALLEEVLGRHLAQWVDGSFDADGNPLAKAHCEPVVGQLRAAIALAPMERRELLEQAERVFPLPDAFDPGDAAHALALRTQLLLVHADGEDRLWHSVRARADRIDAAIQWRQVPMSVCGVQYRLDAIDRLSDAGAYRAALAMQRNKLEMIEALSAQRDPLLVQRALAETHGGIADLLHRLGEYGQAAASARQRLSIMESALTESRAPDVLSCAAAAMAKLGLLAMAHGDVPSARGHYRRALALFRESGADDAPEPPMALIEILSGLADLDRDDDHLDAAEAGYQEVLALSDRLAGSGGAGKRENIASKAMEGLLSLATRRADWPAAIGYAERILASDRRAVERFGTPQDMHDLAGSLRNLATAYRDADDLDAAARCMHECLSIRRELVATQPVPEYVRSLGAALAFLAIVLSDQARIDEAEALFREAIELQREMVVQHGLVVDQLQCARILGNYSALLRRKGALADAMAMARDEVALFREAHAKLDSLQSSRELSKALGSAALLMRDGGEHGEAIAVLHECLQLDGARAGLDGPNLVVDREQLSTTHYRLGRLLESTGSPDEAANHYRQCLEIDRDLVAKGVEPLRKREQTLIGTLSRLAQLAEVNGGYEEAERLLRESLCIQQRHLADGGGRDACRDVGITLGRLGDVLRSRNQLEQARDVSLECVRIARQACAAFDDPMMRRDLSIGLREAGDVELLLGRLDDARMHYRECLEIRQALHREAPDAQAARGDMAVALRKLAEVERRSGDLDAATVLMAEAAAYEKTG